MKMQSAILMFLAVVLVAGIAFDVGRAAIPQTSSDVVTITQHVAQSCTGLNVLSCNALQVAANRTELGLYAAVMGAVVVAGIALWMTARSNP
jgi:p-aminobenzoyl-glutamate transporter AbgT